MIRVYLLPVITIGGVEAVDGSQNIFTGVLDTTPDPDIRRLIMDTTPTQHDALAIVAVSWTNATQDEIDYFNGTVIVDPLTPDTLRAEELLASSPQVITQPEMWQLMRIFGRRHGYRF